MMTNEIPSSGEILENVGNDSKLIDLVKSTQALNKQREEASNSLTKQAKWEVVDSV